MLKQDPAQKALWFIESHFTEDLTLDDVAEAAGVSRYHLSRLFALATDGPVLRYVRARRLTEAARELAAGAPDILAVAIEAGYGSHEAFSRAFRDQFGVTPESVRANGLKEITLLEPIKMDETLLTNLDEPRIENGRDLLIAGISERYSAEGCAAIPAQWQRFSPNIGHIPGEIPGFTYGVIYNGDDTGNIDYLSGVEVSSLPRGLSRVRILEQRYAVFTQKAHISTIRQTWFTIWNRSLPEAGYKASAGPEFERYGKEFNPRTGDGGFEIWIPVK